MERVIYLLVQLVLLVLLLEPGGTDGDVHAFISQSHHLCLCHNVVYVRACVCALAGESSADEKHE